MSNIIKLPGLVDVHVHLREPGAAQKEDFETGTKAAVAGGYTQVLDMPNNTPPTVTQQTLEDKRQLAKGRIWCDVGFNFGGTRSSASQFNKVKNKVFGLKVYMNKTTGTLLVENEIERELIFKNWEGEQAIMIHALGETLETALLLAEKYKRKVHICHITGDQISLIKKAKSKKTKVSCEVTPHHLFLTSDDAERLGPYGQMQPPLNSKKYQQILWKNLDLIDIIATDHAPHTREEKEDINEPKFGVPGLETTVPLIFNALAEKKITIKQIEEMLVINPRKIFNLPTQEDTFTEIDTSKSFTISSQNLFTKCKWTPFEGMVGKGKVSKVVINGTVVYENGLFKGNPLGQTIEPSPNDL